MKRIALSFLLLFAICKIYAQEPIITYSNDGSFLKLMGDSADFLLYHPKYSNKCVKGKGNFYEKDSTIYINTITDINEYYPKFENVGNFPLSEKFIIEVVDNYNNKIPKYDVFLIGSKGRIRYYDIKCENSDCIIYLDKVTKPEYIKIHAVNDSIQKNYVPFEIPIKSIKTNHIKVYLTDVLWIKEKRIRFQKKNDKYGDYVIGPISDVKRKVKLISRRIVETIYPCSVSITMYLETIEIIN